MRKESIKGDFMFISPARMRYTPPASRALGMNASRNMKKVELPAVARIARKSPKLFDTRGLATAENAIVRPDRARYGPLYVSATPNLYHSQVATKGIIRPAPRPMTLLQRENLRVCPIPFMPLNSDVVVRNFSL